MTLRKHKRHKSFDDANRLWDEGNVKAAYELFKTAAEGGDKYAQNTLGYFFDLGIAVPKNKKKALFWYKKAAHGGDTTAYTNIATVYRDAGNVERARFWLLKAFKSSDGDAALELGKLYLKNQNKKSFSQASKYLRLALKSKNITQDSIEEAKLLLEDKKIK